MNELHDVVLLDLNTDIRFTKELIDIALGADHISELMRCGSWFGELGIGNDPLIIDNKRIAFKILKYYWIGNMLWALLLF